MGLTLPLLDQTLPAAPKTRPARALIGWLPEPEAQTLLSLPAILRAPRREHLPRIRRAHAAVAARPAGIDQTGVLAAPGEELSGHIAALGANPIAKQYFDLGAQAAIADLTRICSVQWLVHSDYAAHSGSLGPLLESARQDDMLSLARLTLPLAEATEPRLTYDGAQNAWVLPAAPPNATIVGHFKIPLEPVAGVRVTGYGFCIAEPTSFVCVAQYCGRYFLKDGYHRAVALLERGITRIPVLVETLGPNRPLHVEGRLPDAIILGPHPPLLTDYLHPEVAAPVTHLSSRKQFTIQCHQQQAWG